MFFVHFSDLKNIYNSSPLNSRLPSRIGLGIKFNLCSLAGAAVTSMQWYRLVFDLEGGVGGELNFCFGGGRLMISFQQSRRSTSAAQNLF